AAPPDPASPDVAFNGQTAEAIRPAPYVTDDAAIAAAAESIAALEARLEATIGSAKAQLAAADREIAALTAQLAEAKRALAALAREKAEAEAEIAVQIKRAEDWRKEFYTSNRMLI